MLKRVDGKPELKKAYDKFCTASEALCTPEGALYEHNPHHCMYGAEIYEAKEPNVLFTDYPGGGKSWVALLTADVYQSEGK